MATAASFLRVMGNLSTILHSTKYQAYMSLREIKQAFFQASIEAETHLKAIFSHRFAEQYSSIPYAYLDINCYDPNRVIEAIATISKLSLIISRFRNKKGNSISHYISVHQDVPIWVLMSYIDFGDLKHMLINSTTHLQNNIAKDFYSFIHGQLNAQHPFTPEVMISFVDTINDIRNVCAHNNRLIGFKTHREVKYWKPLHQKYSIPTNSLKNSPYAVMLALQCFLSELEYAVLHNKVRKQCNILEKKLFSISINDIITKLGLPTDWHKTVSKIKV